MDSNDWYTLAAILGLTLVTLITRAFFVIPRRELPLPDWLRRGLKYAPLAALAAVIIPELSMSDGQLIDTWRDARLWATPAACLYFFLRRGILGTIVTGMLVYLPLRLGLGW